MAAEVKDNFIDIDDPDTPIYRVYSLKWFIDLLQTGKDGLRDPSTWDDPFENFLLGRTKVSLGPDSLADLSNLAKDWYGQCWTTNCDTDAMWRIYSACKTGVQVRTTIRKLFDNLRKLPVWSPPLQFFVGRVSYMSQTNICKMMGDLTFTDVTMGGTADQFAKLLCVKREGFQHEQEVRLLYQDIDSQPGGSKGANQTVPYPLDANEIFDEILLDPRLTDAEEDPIKAKLAAAGWKGDMPKSTLYEIPEFVIPAS